MLIEQNILEMLNGVADINSSVITTALNDAKTHITVVEEILDTHPRFDLLHKYYTMHLLQLWGHFEDVVLEEVGDVKSTYLKTAPEAGETKWYLEYQRVKSGLTP